MSNLVTTTGSEAIALWSLDIWNEFIKEYNNGNHKDKLYPVRSTRAFDGIENINGVLFSRLTKA